MKKTFYLFILLVFFASAVFSQNNVKLNNDVQINPPENIQNSDYANQQIVMNNEPSALIQQQAQVINYLPQQKAVVNIAESNPTVNIGVLNNREKTYTTYSTSGSSSKHHYKKSKINLQKIHILRKFRNECPVLQAKTYKKLFSSKKRNIRRCFYF